jgi:diguanylate cyclase (GGDEF)-like protein/PAS domain S-box-containing protein
MGGAVDTSVYEEILDQMTEGVYFVDRQRRITYWNPGAEAITGYSADEVIGHSCSEGILRHVSEAGIQLCLHGCPLAGVMRDGTARQANVYLHHKDGHRVPVGVKGRAIRNAEGDIVGSVELFHQRTATRFADASQRNREEDAFVDALTGIGNRRYGELNLEPVLAAVDADVTSLGVLFLDVDHFKNVNDTFGHRAGDQVLRMVAQNIANGLRATDFPIRWGGEEFIALMPGAEQDSLERAAERLRMLVEHSWIQRDDDQIRVSVSIGATLAVPREGPESLLDRADHLMYASKSAGRNLVTTDAGQLPRGGETPLGGTEKPWEMPGVDAEA